MLHESMTYAAHVSTHDIFIQKLSKFETTCALTHGKLGAKCHQGEGCEKGVDQKGTLEVVDSQGLDR